MPETIAGIKIPDSRMAKDLTELIRDKEPELLYHHSRRVYLFGALTGQRTGIPEHKSGVCTRHRRRRNGRSRGSPSMSLTNSGGLAWWPLIRAAITSKRTLSTPSITVWRSGRIASLARPRLLSDWSSFSLATFNLPRPHPWPPVRR